MPGFFYFDENSFSTTIIVLSWIVGISLALFLSSFANFIFFRKYFRNYESFILITTALIALIFQNLTLAILDYFNIYTFSSLIKNILIILGIFIFLLLFVIFILLIKNKIKRN